MKRYIFLCTIILSITSITIAQNNPCFSEEAGIKMLWLLRVFNTPREEKTVTEAQLYSLLIDTTNYQNYDENTQQIRRNRFYEKSHGAYIMLAARGKTDIIPAMKQRYYESLQGNVKHTYLMGDYLLALDQLGDPDAYPMAKALLDTIITRRQNPRPAPYYIKWIDDAFEKALCVVLHHQDYSYYNYYSSLPYTQINQNYLAWFGRNLPLRSQVYTRYKELLTVPNVEYRAHAVGVLINFKDFSETYTLFKQFAFTDTSTKVRYEAIWHLIEYYNDVSVIPACMALITPPITDTSLAYNVIWRMQDLITPVVKYELQKLLAQLPQGGSYYTHLYYELRDHYQENINEHLDSLSIPATLDTLASFTKQSATLNWIGNANFVNELTLTISNAKNHYLQNNKNKCITELEKYNSKLEKEYLKLNTPRFVTKDGYDFLTDNSKYILERLKK